MKNNVDSKFLLGLLIGGAVGAAIGYLAATDKREQLIDCQTKAVKCVGRTVMVAYDLLENHSIPMPEEWIEAICKYEGRDVRRKK